MSNVEVLKENSVKLSTKIWRYIDFTKFVSLLDKKALYFTRIDKLSDPFEGTTSRENIRLRPRIYEEIIEKFKDFPSKISIFNEKTRKFYLVNCWHKNNYESAAMWSLYLKSDEGIAIQSTIKRLRDSIIPAENRSIDIGKVKYIDYDNDWLPEGNAFYSVLHKRKSFSHENEVRAIYLEFATKPKKDNEEAYEIDIDRKIFSHGTYIEVNLDVLIEAIYISPTAKDWFKELIESVVKKYNFNFKINKSNLLNDPVF